MKSIAYAIAGVGSLAAAVFTTHAVGVMAAFWSGVFFVLLIARKEP